MSDPQSISSVNSDFSVRIVVCDHYVTKPVPGLDVFYSEFRGSDIKQVPVLRVFGPSIDGHKACLHIHGVFPYFYIPCPTSNPEPQFLYQIAASLDKALNIALKQATSTNQHVYKITLVKGLPFYGFHDKDHLYLKVFLYSPNLIKQAVELCSNGAILGQTFQPHESHLNFTLQFFIDFNLFGMSNIELQKVHFRKARFTQNSNDPTDSPDQISLKAESMCFYEGDCIASHIINRQRIGKGDGIENPGLEEVWKQEKERRKLLNMSIASKSLSQGRIRAEETESHYKFDQIFKIKLSSSIDKPITEDNIKRDLEPVYYPAESLESTQLFDAVDVSIHIPENSIEHSLTLKKDLDETVVEDVMDQTFVDENVALNSSLSLHYSQVLLNREDMDLVDLLHDMEEKQVEEDSIMGTPADINQVDDNDSDDVDYSQAFNEDTIIIDPYKSKDGNDEISPSWNDSFWEDVNIPQLDGTCDDDHVKKVRKRKMRSFKLGLSKPKGKKKTSNEDENKSNLDLSEPDEINASRDTIKSISNLHLKKHIKEEKQSIIQNSIACDNKNPIENVPMEELSILELVNKVSVKSEIKAAETYDIENRYVPQAGTSAIKDIKIEKRNKNNIINLSFESAHKEDKGIMSFYDSSKLFDMSLDRSLENKNDNDLRNNLKASQVKSQIKYNIRSSFNNAIILTPKMRPPTNSYITSCLEKYNIPKIRNPQPFYSNPNDVGDKVEIGQMLLKLHSKLARDQKAYEKVLDTTSIEEWRQLMFLQTNDVCNEGTKPDALKKLLAGNKLYILEPLFKPPTTSQIKTNVQSAKSDKSENDNPKETNQDSISKNIDELDNSQALGLNDEINSTISPDCNENDKITNNEINSLQITMQHDGSFLCFGVDHQKDNISLKEGPTVEVDYLTIMLTEVHTSIRGDLHPDPAMDPIQAVFVMITNDCPSDSFLSKTIIEIIVIENATPIKFLDRCIFNVNITYVGSENELLQTIVELVKTHDPDIMCGYEMEVNSWGYILERAQILGMEIVKEVSRITEKNRQKRWRSDENEFEGRIIGRITLNVWRLFRHELALSSYSFENCMYEILKERVPKYSHAQVAEWWNHESRMLRWLPVEYYMTKLTGTVRMLEKLDIINRTSELARLFGLQWWEVLSRGSQFRVESLMLRAARPLNLIALSPTVRQRAAMRAPECLPLIFEPESRFYSDPVIVLDFQSLYPSMMIAYNYCFSTCIGRVQNINGDAAYEFGAWRLRIPKAKLEALVKNGLVHWSPVGVGFVKSSVRRGVLPALLRRILAARQAVKKSMKHQTDPAVKKAMHSRQLGLKLIANVTYGYTAANFSGRMPCVEVGDSVVAKGRETLERAIKLVRNTPEWNTKVVYGDTDSMFVVVPGGTRAEAFAIGQQIADAVTADNPSPVALKLEKVYQPCILQTKKRYVGYMYETPDQEKPVYEAKGIETVRRDGCPAGVKLLQRSLCELFETGDMSRVKRLVQDTLSRLVAGTLPLHDLFFTREYHGPNGYRPGAVAPPNEIAKRIAGRDRRATPRAGERVSWLVAAGAPGTALVRLARAPEELALAPAAPHCGYYAARVLLPPLHRCLSLLGADVQMWWQELGYNRTATERHISGGIARYMWRVRCAVCGAAGARALCGRCLPAGGPVAAARLHAARAALHHCRALCQSCCGHAQVRDCVNAECPVFWRRLAADQRLAEERDVATHIPSHFNNETLDF